MGELTFSAFFYFFVGVAAGYVTAAFIVAVMRS